MGAPAWKVVGATSPADDPELEGLFDDPATDPELSGVFDAPAANDNGAGDGFKPPDTFEPDEPDPRGPPPWADPQDAPAAEPAEDGAPGKVVNVTGPDGGPIQIEGEVPPPEPKSAMQALAETARDSARGLGQGFTMRWGDEGAAALAEAAPSEGSGLDALARRGLNAFGAGLPAADPEAAAIPKTYAAGSRYADLRDNERANNAAASERSPLAYTVGEAAGAIPGAIASAPAGGGALSARIAANMAAGGLYGGISGAGGSTADNAAGVATDALTGAEVGAALGGGVTGVAAKVAPSADRAALALGRLASRARAGASGAYGGELARLTEKHGPQYAEQLGENIERMGLHKRPSPGASTVVGGAGGAALGGAGGAAQSWLSGGDPYEGAKRGAKYGAALGALAGRASTPGVYRANAEAARKRLSGEIGQSIEDATAQGVSFPKSDVIAGMRAKLRTLPKSTPEHRAVRDQLRGLMRDVHEQYAEHMTPKQLQALKKSYEEIGGFKPTQNMPAGDARTAQMYRKAARVPRQALEDSINEQALPETSAQFANARQDFGTARTVENMARKREAQELGNQQLSLAAAATGDPIGAMSVEGMKRVGKDSLADLARAGSRQARNVATAANAIQGAPVGQASGFAGSTARVPQASPAMAQPKSAEQRSEAAGKGTGYRLESAVRDAMARNPQALGPYSQRVQEALAKEDDPNALSALLFQLSQDETFRTQYQPALTGAR